MKIRFLFLISVSAILGCSQITSNTKISANGSGVIGGTAVTDEDLKLATVGVYMIMGNCTGSYIGNNKVVTASHCINDGDAVYVEFNHLEGKFSCNVIKGVMHPQYVSSKEAVWYDVAVLTIHCDDERIKDVKPYSLAKDLNKVGKTFGAGYGLSKQNGDFTFPQLNNMELSSIDMEPFLNDPAMSPDSAQEIKNLLPQIKAGTVSCYKADINNTMFFGDSGGPTFYKSGNKYVLSSVNDAIYAKTEDINTIYAFCGTNISYHRDWILQQ